MTTRAYSDYNPSMGPIKSFPKTPPPPDASTQTAMAKHMAEMDRIDKTYLPQPTQEQLDGVYYGSGDYRFEQACKEDAERGIIHEGCKGVLSSKGKRKRKTIPGYGLQPDGIERVYDDDPRFNQTTVAGGAGPFQFDGPRPDGWGYGHEKKYQDYLQEQRERELQNQAAQIGMQSQQLQYEMLKEELLAKQMEREKAQYLEDIKRRQVGRFIGKAAPLSGLIERKPVGR